MLHETVSIKFIKFVIVRGLIQKYCNRCDDIVKNPRKVTTIRALRYIPYSI